MKTVSKAEAIKIIKSEYASGRVLSLVNVKKDGTVRVWEHIKKDNNMLANIVGSASAKKASETMKERNEIRVVEQITSRGKNGQFAKNTNVWKVVNLETVKSFNAMGEQFVVV